MARLLQLLPVPTGERVLGIIPALQAALAGAGPALLPVPADDETESARLAGSLGAGTAMADWADELDDPTAVVIATSGSTGTPKGALLPASALAASAEATRRRLTIRPEDGQQAAPGHWLLALSATHIAGLQVILRAVAEGTEPTVLDTAASFTAERFVSAVDRMPTGPRFTSLVPTQLSRILSDPAAVAALGTFNAVLVGGASTSAALLRDAEQAGIKIITTYGMSETCGGCVYNGVPLDGVTVAGSQSAGGPAHRPERISITGPVVARGYRGRPDHPSFSRGDGDRFRTFRTDDLAVLDGGNWRIVGRVDDVITTGGIKIDPAVVEAILLQVSDVAEVIVTGVPDPAWGEVLVAVVVPAAGGAPDLRTLRAAAGTELGAAAAPRHLVLTERLPLRGPGKPDRAAIRELATAEISARILTGSAATQVTW
ncbi:MAG: o-succinylbenzoate--CoA ligase [Nakamurella sp.]